MENSSIAAINKHVPSLLLFFFFGLLALSLLAPLSSDYLPVSAADTFYHVSNIVEAKMALKEGQFPIRTTPTQLHGWGYALFQYYSPFPYIIAGEIYRIGFTHDPYTAFKFVIWLSLLFAGWYWYKIAELLTGSPVIGMLTGFAYMSAPYLLINFIARADFGETVAQGIIPIVIYYTFLNYYHPLNIRHFIYNSLAWFALLTSHMLTSVYFSGFIGLLFILLTLQRFQLWKRLICLGLSFLSAFLLAAWFFVPIFLSYTQLGMQGSDPFISRWLTPLPNLLSVTAVSPMPLPGSGSLNIPLYSSVGWPMLLAAGITLYYIATRKVKNISGKKEIDLVKSTFILFLFAILLVCPPFDIYSYLPSIFAKAQFTYRLLAQVMWLGTLLFIFAFLWAFGGNLNIRHVVVGTLLLGLAASPWLPTLKSGNIQLSYLTYKPYLRYTGAFLVTPQEVNTQMFGNTDKSQLLVQQTQKECTKKGYLTKCTIINNSSKNQLVQLPILYYPNFLSVKINGNAINYYPTYCKSCRLSYPVTLASVLLAPGTSTIEAYFRGSILGNWTSIIAWILLISSLIFSFLKNLNLSFAWIKIRQVKS